MQRRWLLVLVCFLFILGIGMHSHGTPALADPAPQQVASAMDEHQDGAHKIWPNTAVCQMGSFCSFFPARAPSASPVTTDRVALPFGPVRLEPPDTVYPLFRPPRLHAQA